jgi:threonine synthase
MWRYAEALPFAGSTAPARVTMGEGGTPLVDVAAGRTGRPVVAKIEFASATLSFKDRGAAVLVAAVLERGAATPLVADSSGNAGVAIAAYAARAGIPCVVFVGEGVAAPKLAQLRSSGADVRLVRGTREDVAAAAARHVERTGATYASHVDDPMFVEGTKTFAFEVWEQLGDVPDTVVVPAGNGTLLLGVAQGFAELAHAGAVDRGPRIVAVQAAACAPLAAAFATGADDVAPIVPGETVAEGIAIAAPRRGRAMVDAVRASGGTVVTVDDDEIEAARMSLGRQGLDVESTAAVAVAAAARLDDEAGTVVVPLTGAGLKHREPA